MGGLTAYNPLGGSVHALYCIKVNEITQGAGTTAAGVLSLTHAHLTDSGKQHKRSSLVAN